MRWVNVRWVKLKNKGLYFERIVLWYENFEMQSKFTLREPINTMS